MHWKKEPKTFPINCSKTSLHLEWLFNQTANCWWLWNIRATSVKFYLRYQVVKVQIGILNWRSSNYSQLFLCSFVGGDFHPKFIFYITLTFHLLLLTRTSHQTEWLWHSVILWMWPGAPGQEISRRRSKVKEVPQGRRYPGEGVQSRGNLCLASLLLPLSQSASS